MQKEQLITIGIVLFLGLLGGLYFALDPFSEDEEIVVIPDPVVSSPAAKEIKETVKTLSKKSWNKTEYQKVDSKIRTSYTNQLISAAEQTSLEEFLNLSYIQTLNKAAKNFFASARNENGLSSIYSELKRYNGTSYRADIIEMKNACGNFYGLKKLKNKIGSFDYFYDGGKSQIENYFNNLDDYGRKKYLTKNPLVNNMINNAKSSLKSKMSSAVIAELRPKIKDYISFQEQTDGVTNAFRQELSELEQNRFLSGDNNVNSFASTARNDLDSHEEVALQMGNVRFNTKSCEEICGRHLYYISVCDGKKGTTQDNINVQDSTVVDTTGN